MFLKIKPEMRDVLGKMRECGKYVKMRDFPHDCGRVDTYAVGLHFKSLVKIVQCTAMQICGSHTSVALLAPVSVAYGRRSRGA